MRFNAHRHRLGRRAAIHKPQKSANRQIAGSYSKQKCGSDGENDGRECHERQQTVLKLRCCPSKLSLSLNRATWWLQSQYAFYLSLPTRFSALAQSNVT